MRKHKGRSLKLCCFHKPEGHECNLLSYGVMSDSYILKGHKCFIKYRNRHNASLMSFKAPRTRSLKKCTCLSVYTQLYKYVLVYTIMYTHRNSLCP